MTVFPLLAFGFMDVVAVFFFICALALILIILVQKGKGGGLSGAFGGGMVSGILGSKTGDFLTWVTIVLVGIFLTLAVVVAKYYKPPDDLGGDTTPPITSSPELPRSPELPSPLGETGTPLGGESTDINSPGIR